MADINRELLEIDSEELTYKQLLMPNSQSNVPATESSNFRSVVPKPGFCIKTKTEQGEKVFINVCKGETLPAPKNITDDEILKLLESDDPSGFRIPLSLGEPHAELDKGGKGCTAYDVMINPSFYDLVQQREILMGFFLTVVLEGLEAKYTIDLDRNWRILKNKKFIGSLPEQNIRTQSKPWIMEMDDSNANTPVKSKEVKQPEKPKAPEPRYSLIQEPPEGYPDYVIAEIHLPKVKMAASLTLDIGEDRILLETRSNVYRLDVYLPFNIIQDDCTAQFNRKTQIMTVTMPVQPKVG